MFTTITLTISLIANAGLIYYLFKQTGDLKDLEIKLKVTRDYANEQAEKSLAKARKFAHESKDKIKSVKQVIENAKEEIQEQVAQVPKKRRGRRKKNTTTNTNV
jgi:tricorn protease-like protein